MNGFQALFLAVALLSYSCTQVGNDPEDSSAPKYFINPVFAGFYPDPSICKSDDGYYLINSSFGYFPGLPIFHSKDLVNWNQIGHVMDRPEQFNTQGQRITRGLFAPAIAFHRGTYYVTCTNVDDGGNFIVKTTDPTGPWSDPIWLPQVNGIDPSLFFEDDRAFIVYNSEPPNNDPLYGGHRTIRMYELDSESLQPIGDEHLLVNGGVDISKEPVWIEGPHIYHINDYYYLMCAEGGTADNHSEVIFRSKSITGPYKPWHQNPILTQRNLDPNRPSPITTTGHADIVQTDDGDWWAVFLGCRPYPGNFYNIGRETFLAPVTWTEDLWPVINPDFEEVQYSYPTPTCAPVSRSNFQYSGNFSFREEFEGSELPMNLVFLRTPTEKWYHIRKGQLIMDLRPETVAGFGNPSYIAHRQQHHQGSVETKLNFKPINENEKAGIVFFQSEKNHYVYVKSLSEGESVLELYRSGVEPELLARQTITDGPVELRVDFDKSDYTFLYFQDGWQTLADHIDGTFLSTQKAGGFVGTTIGLYATSSGQKSTNNASFGYFSYSGNDDVFNKLGAK